MNPTHYLACDLGAETGRIVLGTLSKGHLALNEIHRFSNVGRAIDDHPSWDLAALEREIRTGIEKAAKLDLPISGFSADACGSDYVLLDREGRPLHAPVCGGEGDSTMATARLLKKLPLATLYAETGTPLLPLHALFQIEAAQAADPTLFQHVESLLPLADYLNTRFSGTVACEESVASTTQLYNPRTHAWSPSVLAALNLPEGLLPRVVPSGTAFGPVIDDLRQHPALLNTRVIATCSHNIAAAIAAIPARLEQNWAWLHSDCRSQFGIECAAPIISSPAREHGFANAVGLGGSTHFFKEGAGLGLLHTCRRTWEADGQGYTEDQLIRLAQQSGPACAHFPPNDPRFHGHGALPAKIAAYCRESDQPLPVKPGEFARVILESLALEHAETLRQIETLTGQEIDVLHVVGRGAGQDLLYQLTADATGLTVIAGPEDAAAIGNLLIQALALWHLKSPDHLRSVVASSFPTRIFNPGDNFSHQVRERFRALGESNHVSESALATV